MTSSLLPSPIFLLRNTYSALNALAGHYNNFGSQAPIPKKRLERLVKVGSGSGRKGCFDLWCYREGFMRGYRRGYRRDCRWYGLERN
jgi:hypothetical protein